MLLQCLHAYMHYSKWTLFWVRKWDSLEMWLYIHRAQYILWLWWPLPLWLHQWHHLLHALHTLTVAAATDGWLYPHHWPHPASKPVLLQQQCTRFDILSGHAEKWQFCSMYTVYMYKKIFAPILFYNFCLRN